MDLCWHEPEDGERTEFDIAQICPNGHVANYCYLRYPEHNQAHCAQCGEPTIIQCPKCEKRIRGHCYIPGVVGITPYDRPAHCQECGAAFPWTESAIQAAIELSVEAANLSEEEEEVLRKSIDDLVKTTPRAPLGAERFKRFLGKAGNEATKAVRSILTDVLSEAAKKTMWGS